MANEQEREPQADTPAATDASAAEAPQASETQGDLDLSPVIKKKDDGDVPYEVVSVDTQPGSRIDAKVQVPEAEFEKRLENLLKDLRKTVVVDGFRRGHAPLRILRNMYGKDAKQEAIEKMKESIVDSLAKKNDWSLAGESELKDYEAEAGKPVVATYSFEIYPKIEIADELVDSVSVNVETSEVTDAMVDAELEKLRQANATYEAKAADQPFDPETDGVAVDLFVTDSRGGNIAELSRMDEFVARPKSDLPAEVVNALAGKKAGEHVDAQVPQAADEGETPETYTYHVDIQSIKTLRLPALDDEFAKDVNDKFQTLDDLRNDIRRDMEEQNLERRRSQAVGAVLENILEKQPFEVPRNLVVAAAAGQIERQERELRQLGVNLSQILGDRVRSYVENTTQNAEATVKISLLLQAIARQKGFESTDEDMQKEFERLGEKAGRSPLAIRAQYEARKKLDSLKTELLQRKVEDFLLEHAKVTYKSAEEAKAEEAKAEEPKAEEAKAEEAKAEEPKAEEAKAEEAKAEEAKAEEAKAEEAKAEEAKAEEAKAEEAKADEAPAGEGKAKKAKAEKPKAEQAAEDKPKAEKKPKAPAKPKSKKAEAERPESE